MLGQSYFQLISPLIFMVFAGGFLVLWLYAREIGALRCFALSYFFGSCAFLGDFLRTLMHTDVATVGIYVLHSATTVAFCAGLYAFYRGRVAWRPLATITAVNFALLFFFRYGFENTGLRIWAMNTGVMALIVHTVYVLRHDMRRRIDHILQAALLSSVFLIMLRTAVVLWLEGTSAMETNYAGSVAAISLHFCIAIAALALASILFVMFGLEIVGRLTATSQTDPLTGVLNRRGLDARVAALSASRDHREHAVVLADIDRFKAVNDRYGHEAGDRVIATFARILVRSARADDIIARWGGEEFMVVMPGADAAMARLYAESVRTAFEAIRHDGLGGETVTASFGVTAWPGARPISEATHMADRALYRAKRAGRNCVSVDGAEAPADFSRTSVA